MIMKVSLKQCAPTQVGMSSYTASEPTPFAALNQLLDPSILQPLPGEPLEAS